MEPKGTVRLLPDKRHGTQHKKLSNEMKENFGATLFRDCLFEATTNDAPSLAPNQDPPEMRRGHRRQHRLGFLQAEPKDHQPPPHRWLVGQLHR